ncbi:methyltransferase type 11 [Niabella ginsenosidivorans]|uniref:Methyltransferase type 11 n=1 Tax=Niabella ginsenosidivorans TaxID=1176587 RepID=A0A1A9I055_9BACT|nr:class I SAM-dependent methyltransferase [Niabella ginsenosidivorans]ANH81006.1 methyltransferase type 11 [Niabella ginsenosidivorans]
MSDSTTRFSNRVADYVKYRPHYPEAVVTFLENDFQLHKGMTIADIGSGTGISSELFLKKGYTVLGIEPNTKMREKSREQLEGYNHFTAVNGTAEATTLSDSSVDAIFAGQAFHWFNRELARPEFERVLKPEGIAALIWNERLTGSPFEKEYEQLIRQHGNQYKKVAHRNIDEAAIEQFFTPHKVTLKAFPNQQVLDYTGLEGRLLSSSYMPARQDAGYINMVTDLKDLFNRYQINNHITIHYTTKVYVAVL